MFYLVVFIVNFIKHFKKQRNTLKGANLRKNKLYISNLTVKPALYLNFKPVFYVFILRKDKYGAHKYQQKTLLQFAPRLGCVAVK
jgi:hypothetical protein